MPIVNDMLNLWRNIRAYALGKGFMMTLMVAAGAIGAMTPLGVFVPALAVWVGGFMVSAAKRFREEKVYQDGMVKLYRDDIAQTLGVPPEQVTRAHLKEAAKSNDVIKQALERRHQRTLLSLATTAVAGAVTFALVLTLGGATGIHTYAVEHWGNILGNLANFVGIGTVASLSNLIVHNGGDAAIGELTGIRHPSAHDYIRHMERRLDYGRNVNKDQVFSLVVKATPELSAQIQQHFNKPFEQMHSKERAAVMQAMGLDGSMATLTKAMNESKVRPRHIAFHKDTILYVLAVPQEPGISEVQQEKAPQRSFVEKLGSAPRKEMSHVARLETQRSHGTPVQPTR